MQVRQERQTTSTQAILAMMHLPCVQQYALQLCKGMSSLLHDVGCVWKLCAKGQSAQIILMLSPYKTADALPAAAQWGTEGSMKAAV